MLQHAVHLITKMMFITVYSDTTLIDNLLSVNNSAINFKLLCIGPRRDESASYRILRWDLVSCKFQRRKLQNSLKRKSKQTETKTSLEEEESCQCDNKPGFVLCEQYQLSIC